jgi:hypothetical protein
MLHYNKKFTSFGRMIILSGLTLFLTSNAKAENYNLSAWINAETKNSLTTNNYNNNTLHKSLGMQLEKKVNNFDTKLRLNFIDQKIKLDQSYVQYQNSNITFGVGKVKRNWSFSPRTSLILSENARPSDSIYLTVRNQRQSKNIFNQLGLTSFEVFNSILSNENGPVHPMMLGLRTVIQPFDSFKFELTKTSQWGGGGYNTDLSALRAAILGNSNENTNANINQLAGFGFSYLINLDKMPINIYSQFIGEDEAGNLPSCYMYLYGTQIELNNFKKPTKIGLEVVDTRIDETKHKYCGANTAYNNATYRYTNYGRVLGAPIDTEGKSISLWGSSKLSENTNLTYSIEKLILNDANWSNHRLNSSSKNGWLAKIGSAQKINSLELRSEISYQDFSLDTAQIRKGFSFRLNAKYIF